jgi:hypothetical protein
MTLSAATFTFWSGPLLIFFSFSKTSIQKIKKLYKCFLLTFSLQPKVLHGHTHISRGSSK